MKTFKKLILPLLVLIATFGISTAQTKPVKIINVDQFEKLRKAEKDLVILDVRTPEEIADGKIKGAKTIDFMDKDFQSNIEKLDKNKTYVVYCKVGGRSGKAVALMNAAGFKSTYSLDGGILAWQEKGKPIEK